MSKVCVVGGGAAGMMAAISAAEAGHNVILIERNEKLGKKIYITGKGRCNFTNASPLEDYFKCIPRNPKFLYSALYDFSNDDVMDFFQNNGCNIKIERGNRAFPESDHASDITKALSKRLNTLDVEVHLNERVLELDIRDNVVIGLKTEKGYFACDSIVIATGGLSYPSTGSTGDGINMAKESGHEIKDLFPSLVPFETKEGFVKDLMGLALKNVEITIENNKGKKLYSDFGEMLFTHFGVSGPLILSASSVVNKHIEKENLMLYINLKPALTLDQVENRVLKELTDNINKSFINAMSSLFPGKLTPVIIKQSGIDPDLKCNEVTREMRDSFVKLIRRFPLTLTGVRDYKEAIVTRGGVSVKDVNPHTMESKIVKGLYFAGEVLDLDAFTGGYNLQIAWSTGHLAGKSIE